MQEGAKLYDEYTVCYRFGFVLSPPGAFYPTIILNFIIYLSDPFQN